MPGYHLSKIPKGKLGEISKIDEEYMEWLDARMQDSKIMMAVELSDMLGAYLAFLEKHPEPNWMEKDIVDAYINFINKEAVKLHLGYYDLLTFSKITKRAFESGERK